MLSLAFLGREVLLSAFGAGREKEGLQKSKGIAFCLAILMATDRRDV